MEKGSPENQCGFDTVSKLLLELNLYLSSTGLFLVGIWFDKIPEKTLVWSANHDDPVRAGSKAQVLWESFEFPTDTIFLVKFLSWGRSCFPVPMGQ
ncbi:hypothetical protein MTR67_041097 [Solanum verrucosum]|uniref:Uncharacterized protein n=1 Tax=Solanum verrucosum TaxID=315347 RepID=A0AAF0UKD9_SOLVR|nr:hypothetical protein MTR67_041097 [Solanum verrucosum]